MKKSVKIIISVLAIVLICAISFDVLLVNNSKQETPVNTTQNIENQATESEEKTYSNPVEAQARKMVENMTLYEKVGQMLLYYIPKEEPLKKMARWQFGGYILFSRNFQNSTPANTRSEIEEYQKASKIPAFMAVDEEGGGVNRVSQFSQYRSEPFHAGITNYQKGGWQAVEADAKDKSEFMLDLGINTVLAPVADVPYSRSDYIYSRAFSTDADSVSEYVSKTVGTMKENNL